MTSMLDSSGPLQAANVPDVDDIDIAAVNVKKCPGATPLVKKKLFFTTSDLIERMNSAIKDAKGDIPTSSSNYVGDSNCTGGFELQMKLPDGSYRRADQKEVAAADFQTKMKQASERIAGFNSQQKMEWAKCHRLEGNALFAKGEYAEAMDVYLTCLVAMDHTCDSTTSVDKKITPPTVNTDEDPSSESRMIELQMEREIKLPVLLNLALCSLKMGMLSKAEKFCNFAMETEVGKQSPKASFCRGRARLLMGNYSAAESDLNNALNLLRAKQSLSDEKIENFNSNEIENEEAVILREKLKLQKLVRQAQKNRIQQKKAMEKIFKPDQTACCLNETGREITHKIPSIYPDKKHPSKITAHSSDVGNRDKEADCQPTCLQWYLRMMGRCAQKILDIIGDDGENEEVDVPVDQDLLNIFMKCKKIA